MEVSKPIMSDGMFSNKVDMMDATVNVLPNQSLFHRLLILARREPPLLAIRDVNAGCERTYAELLSDVLSLRATVLQSLSQQIITKLNRGENVCIAVIASGGYEFSVAALAVLATGAALVMLTPLLPVKEAKYFIEKAECSAVLCQKTSNSLGKELERQLSGKMIPNFKHISILSSLFATLTAAEDITIAPYAKTSLGSTGLIIYTSGTTGPPKGAALSVGSIYNSARAVGELYGVEEKDLLLHLLPVHHATGICVMFFPFLVAGATVEFRSGGFDEKWTWERWRQGMQDKGRTIQHFSAVPTIYMRMKRYFENVLAILPSARSEEYTRAAKQFKACICGTSALPKPISDFWTTMTGRRVLQRYGATEAGPVFTMDFHSAQQVPDGSVGKSFPGLDVKLSEGEEGELLIKSPYMLLEYIGDPIATKNAFDADGYFKTGDILLRRNDYYFVLGRASIDIIKSGGYKISALDIEREILGLPYVAEVMVIGVADDEWGQRVAAAIVLQNENATLSIEQLRNDLRPKLAAYKLPTLLRIVHGEFPKSGTGKVVKKTLGPRYFPSNLRRDDHVQSWTPTKPKL